MIYQNIGGIDARGLTAERTAQIEAFINVGAVIIGKGNRALLDNVKMTNVGIVLTIEDEVVGLMLNGDNRLALSPGEQKKVFLLCNGSTLLEPELRAETLLDRVSGGVINGSLICKRSQYGALSACGVTVNGETCVYPDDFRLRQGAMPFTAGEVALLSQGEQLYLAGKPLLEEGVAALLAQKGVHLDGKDGLMVYQNEGGDLGEVWAGDPSAIEWVPQGYKVRGDSLEISPRNAPALRGKILVLGDVVIEEKVTLAQLAGLQGLVVRGKLMLPLPLMEGLVERISGEPEWVPYEGRLLHIKDKLDLTPEMVEQWPRAVSIYNTGLLQVDPAISAEVLKEKVSLFYNGGILTVSDAQRAALQEVLLGDGVIQSHRQEEMPVQEEDQSGVVANMGYLTL